jgi:hypothetical protein
VPIATQITQMLDTALLGSYRGTNIHFAALAFEEVNSTRHILASRLCATALEGQKMLPNVQAVKIASLTA